MSWTSIDAWSRRLDAVMAETSGPAISRRLQIFVLAVRAAFMILLLVMIAHASAPQSTSLWSAYEALGDLIRVAVGLVACIGIVIQLFTLPKDIQAYRTWLFLGLVMIPFMTICVIGTW